MVLWFTTSHMHTLIELYTRAADTLFSPSDILDRDRTLHMVAASLTAPFLHFADLPRYAVDRHHHTPFLRTLLPLRFY